MATLITLLVICLIVAVCIWLINQIPAPVPPIVRSIAIAIVIILALMKVLPMLGAGF